MATRKTPAKSYLNELTWEEKAQQNPLYAVMSVDEFADSGAPTEDEISRFYARGREIASGLLLPWLHRHGVGPEHTVMEFGCGMGRLLNALAEHHPSDHLRGVDISTTMVELGRQSMEHKVELAALTTDGLIPFPDQSADFAYSYAVFQHIADWNVVQRSLDEILRVLKHGGRARFQFWMVADPRGFSSDWSDSLAFGRRSLIYGWTRKGGRRIPRARIHKSNNWSGSRPGLRQILGALTSRGAVIEGVSFEPNFKMTWIEILKT